jgi:hypothetical protein
MRRLALAAACILGAAACGSGGGNTARATSSDPSAPGEVPAGASALDDPFDPSLPEPLVEEGDLRSGGPPPDGIPAIDEPKFLAVDDVDFLADDEPVLALEVDGDARAYPVQILTWHEIVNDEIGGEPITVSYCPLCNSAVAYVRKVDGAVLDFGTSGLLYNSSLVMYDRQTESLWSHYTATAIAGVYTGTELETRPLQMVGWSVWRDAHPDGKVLSRDTGHERDYGRNPYPGYDDIDDFPFLYEGEVDGRYPAKTRIVGVRLGDDAVAVVLDHLATEHVVAFDADAQPVVVWHVPGTASALDAGAVADGRDVGTTGAFVAAVEGRTLTFEADGDGFVDAETGSRWDVFGEAVAGELAGTRLTPVEHLDTFWFAWVAFRPDTTVID